MLIGDILGRKRVMGGLGFLLRFLSSAYFRYCVRVFGNLEAEN